MRARGHVFILALGLLLGSLASGPPAERADGAPDTSEALFPVCAWRLLTTATTVNVAFPDAGAAYWTTPFLITQDLEAILVQGPYPNARYMSLTVYDDSGGTFTCQGVRSELTDFQIQPDPGSQNPFAEQAPLGGTFSLTVRPLTAPPTEPNVLPLAPCSPPSGEQAAQNRLPTNLGFLVYRIYLPHDDLDQVPLPALSLRLADGQVVALPQCMTRQPSGINLGTDLPNPEPIQSLLQLHGPAGRSAATGVKPCGRPGAQQCPPELVFFRPTDATTNSFFPNLDNKYIAALVQPKPQQLLVLRAQGATVPSDRQPAPWPNPNFDLRYWSMCSNIYRRPWPVVAIQEGDQTILGCAADLETVLDEQNFYTYVVSHVADKPSDAILAANHATWLPFSRKEPFSRHMMILRNLLGDGFPYSVQNCAQGSDSTAIESCQQTMGSYYPEVAECHVRTLEQGGVNACFGEFQLRQE
jgi:hypothetical protein